MRDHTSVLTGDVRAPADIYGVHGAAGLTHWKCLASRRDLAGEWEAVEWASIPPGGLSGEHRHTRTEELYLVLDGEGEFLANGQVYPALPGRLLLTGLGSVHGLRNVGERHLNWLVVEMPVPAVSARLRASSKRGSEDHMTIGLNGGTAPELTRPARAVGLYDLYRQGSVDPGTVFTGPMRTIEIIRLAPRDEHRLTARGSEHTLFVLAGAGRAVSGETTVELAPGRSVTLPLGTEVELRAHDDGLELFHAELAVSGEGAR